jgi:hypothetical protein
LTKEEGSIFSDVRVEHFRFEEDFVTENMRCIPMIVRFKMDTAGIKLTLAEWCKFKSEEREDLAMNQCSNHLEVAQYRLYLQGLVQKYTGRMPSEIPVSKDPEWRNSSEIPVGVLQRVQELQYELTIAQWERLGLLQRFALLKLSRPGHESRNFLKALKEFKIIS